MADESAIERTLREIARRERAKAMARGDYAFAIATSIFEDALGGL